VVLLFKVGCLVVFLALVCVASAAIIPPSCSCAPTVQSVCPSNNEAATATSSTNCVSLLVVEDSAACFNQYVELLPPGKQAFAASNIGGSRADAVVKLVDDESLIGIGVMIQWLISGPVQIQSSVWTVDANNNPIAKLATGPATTFNVVANGPFQYYEAPISFNLIDGQHYSLAVDRVDDGATNWGFSMTNMMFFNFDQSSDSPFVSGNFKVVDGSESQQASNFVMPQLRLHVAN